MTRTTQDLEAALHAAETPYATDRLQPNRLSTIREGGRRHRRRRVALAVGGAAAAVVLVAGGALAVTTGVGETPAPGPVDRPPGAPERPGASGPVGTLIVDDSTPFGAAVADDLRTLAYSGRRFAEGLRVGDAVLRFGCRPGAGLGGCLPARLDDDGTAQRLVWDFADGPDESMDVYLTERSSALGRMVIAWIPAEAASVDVFIRKGVARGQVDTELGDGTVMWLRDVGKYPQRIVARDASGLVVAEQELPGP